MTPTEIKDVEENTLAQDCTQRFLFSDADIRGEWVTMQISYQDILIGYDYPLVVANLLGEFAAASLLLSSTIKFEGRLTLQVRSEGEVQLLMVEATHKKTLRALARTIDSVTSSDFDTLLKDATLVVTVEPDNGERYQSLVPLSGHNLATSLVHYFEQSEQLSTVIHLSANGKHAAGLLLQRLPSQKQEEPELSQQYWQHISTLLETNKTEVLNALELKTLLRKLFCEEPIQLMQPKAVIFKCNCTQERMGRALFSIGSEALESLFEEQISIEINCEFCQQNYAFTREILAELRRDNKLNKRR